jgi:predicted membrane protein
MVILYWLSIVIAFFALGWRAALVTFVIWIIIFCSNFEENNYSERWEPIARSTTVLIVGAVCAAVIYLLIKL